MTRFAQLQRIEDAIKHRDAAALAWAAGYCRMRVKLARLKPHRKHWQSLLDRVTAAIGAVPKGR